MLSKFRFSVLLSVVMCVLFTACNKDVNTVDKEGTAADSVNGSYFSVKQFAADQWQTYRGQPFAIAKLMYVDGKRDSVMTDGDNVDWGSIFRMFFATDISDKKFLNKYSFSSFTDDATMSNNYYYEAKEPGLFTRKLHIIADDVSNKIKSIYIETEQKTKLGVRTQRLFYIPVNIITIQEFESTAVGDKKELRVEYRFM